MRCPELRALMSAYSARTAEYSASVSRLKDSLGIPTKEDYEALSEDTHRAHDLCKTARKAVEKHRQEHGCM